jgi:hypothetical protein
VTIAAPFFQRIPVAKDNPKIRVAVPGPTSPETVQFADILPKQMK